MPKAVQSAVRKTNDETYTDPDHKQGREKNTHQKELILVYKRLLSFVLMCILNLTMVW